MIRLACLGSLLVLLFAIPLIAEPPGRPAIAAPGVERAMAAAREHLRAGRPADAVRILEAELLNADRDPAFLSLLRETYTALLRELQSNQGDGATIESVRRRLLALDRPSATPKPPATAADLAATVRPPAPPIPDPPLGPPPTPAAGEVGDDPFQQAVRERATRGVAPRRASDAFAARRYAEAAKLFGQAVERGESLSRSQRDEWAYSRMHAVAMGLNGGVTTASDLADLAREVEEARQAGSEQLAAFGNQLLVEIRRRTPAAASGPAEAGWQVVDTPSFRVMHRGQAAVAAEVGQTAESARKDMYDRWSGSPTVNWTPRCDIYLHPTAAEYAKATGKPADGPGHSTVGMAGGRVASRRIDLRLDEPALMDAVLPSEVTQVVLADVFADQPLPRWALVGMAALSESPEGVARYQRAVPGLLREKKLYAVGPFIDQPNFPAAAAVTAFYAESVSLVSYLVELKGPKAFATFLREAPRRGYARALSSHYGFKDAADLQDRWVKHVLGGE